MVNSQNGWPANNRSLISSYSVPGGRLAIRKGDVAKILVYIAEEFHNRVEPLKWPGNWGYAERKVRGGSSVSNHASGTAIDLNAPAHWLGEVGTFTSSQVSEIRKILDEVGGVVRWGGDYSGRKDEMHFEINASSSAVARAADNIGYGEWHKGSLGSRWMSEKCCGDDVKEAQQILVDSGESLKVDGWYGSGTAACVKSYQKKNNLDVDGKIGPQTTAHMKGEPVKRRIRNIGYDFPLPDGHWFGTGTSRNLRRHNGTRNMEDAWHIYRIVKALKMFGHEIDQTSKFYGYVEEEVKKFQRDKGLDVDGVVGPSTWKRIDNERWIEV